MLGRVSREWGMVKVEMAVDEENLEILSFVFQG